MTTAGQGGARVAIVTGAAGGLGRAHALRLAASGCQVVVNDVGVDFRGDRPSADAVVAEIRAAGGVAVADGHDVVSEASAVVATAVDAFGGVDVVVNNAGTAAGTPIGPGAAEEWRATLATSIDGSIGVTGAAWPHLVTSDAGRVVMTASNAMFGARFTPAYSTAKSALYGLTRSLAGAGRRDGIGVNCVLPAAWTRLVRALPPGPVAELMEGRFPPEAVSSFVAWLCDPSCAVSGESFSVGGGRAARVLLAENRGVEPGLDAGPAEWAALADELMGTADVGFPLDIDDEVSWQAHNLSGDVPEGFRPGGPLDWARRAR